MVRTLSAGDPERHPGGRRHDPEAALGLVAGGNGPHHSDPRVALSGLAIPIRATALWRWPFARGVDYLVCATLAGAIPRAVQPRRMRRPTAAISSAVRSRSLAGSAPTTQG